MLRSILLFLAIENFLCNTDIWRYFASSAINQCMTPTGFNINQDQQT